jgi:hypothetical protein
VDVKWNMTIQHGIADVQTMDLLKTAILQKGNCESFPSGSFVMDERLEVTIIH